MPPKNKKTSAGDVRKMTYAEIAAEVKRAREVEHKGAGLDLKINAVADELDDDTMKNLCEIEDFKRIFTDNDDEDNDPPTDKADFKSYAKDWNELTQ